MSEERCLSCFCDPGVHRNIPRTQDSDCGQVISSHCVRHTLGISPDRENTDDRQAGSPCDLDHLGFKGLHMLQKGLHGLSCVNYGLREGKSKGKGRDEEGGTFESRMTAKYADYKMKNFQRHVFT